MTKSRRTLVSCVRVVGEKEKKKKGQVALALLVCFCSMAPRKRKAEGVEGAAVKRVAETTLTRVTRSVTRRVNSNLAESSVELAKAELPTKNKKAKATGKKNKKKKKEDVKAEEEIEAEKVKVQEDVVEPETEEAEEEVEPDKEEAAGDAFDGDESKERTVVIEHW